LQALVNNTSGADNTAVGRDALANNISGSNNIALGVGAGTSVTAGNNNIDIGNAGGGANNIHIGDSQTAAFIAGISGVSVTGAPVVVNVLGQLGVAPSSQRFKEQIKPMDKASEALLALKPVTFRYKNELDPQGIPQFGLLAEEVARVNPDLVVRDAKGQVYTVRYEAVNAMLLNEFLKEHHAFVEEQRKVEQQQKDIDFLKAELKEQRSLIQKVSESVKMKRSTAQMVSTR
jgi:hypothetical protein